MDDNKYEETVKVLRQRIGSLRSGVVRSVTAVTLCAGFLVGSASVASGHTIAQVASNSVIVVRTPQNGLRYYWQTIGSPVWRSESVAGAGTTMSTPTVARVGNSTVIAALGPGGLIKFYWEQIGSTVWHPQSVGYSGANTPDVAQVGNSSVIATQGGVIPDGSLHFWWQGIGSPTWHGETVAAAQNAPDTAPSVGPPSVAQVGRSAVIASRGPFGELYFWWQAIGSPTWHKEVVDGQYASASWAPPVVAQVGDASVIVTSDPYGGLDYYYQRIGTSGWNKQQVLGPQSWIDRPSIAPVGDSAVIVGLGPKDAAVSSLDGPLDYFWQTIATTQWHEEQVAGAGATSPLVVDVAQVGDSSVIDASTPKGALDFYWQKIGTPTWHKEQVAGPGAVS